MIAGSGSGSIVAAGLTFKSKLQPLMSAGDIVDFFTTNGVNIFEPHVMSLIVHIVFWALIAIAFLCLGLWLGYRRYNNK